MKKNFFLVIAILGIACAALVSCDSGNTTSTEVIYEGLDTSNVMAPFMVTSEDPNFILVKQGDNLWNLSLAKWGEPQWRRFFENNSFLSEPGRVRNKNGETIVFIYPGEKLDFSGINEIPVSTRLKETVVTIMEKDKAEILGLPWWGWVIPVIVLWAIIKGLLDDERACRNKNKNKNTADPATQGPPVYQNGLNDTNVRNHYENRAAQEGINLSVRNIRKGKLYSEEAILTEYRDHDRPAIYNGQVGYEAEVVLPNGEVELRRTLQDCGNDLRRGANIPNVRFIADANQPEVLNRQSLDPNLKKKIQTETKNPDKTEKVAEEKASAGELMLQIIDKLQESGADGVEIHIGSTNFKATKLNKNSESVNGH